MQSPSIPRCTALCSSGPFVKLCQSLTLLNKQSSSIPSNKLVFRIRPIQQITRAQPYIWQHETTTGNYSWPSRCISLPERGAAKILLRKFIRDLNHLPYVVHVPSLPIIVDEIYANLDQQHQLKSGHAVLLLGILAAGTHCWIQEDCERGLFATAAEANEQASVWIKAIEDVLDVAHRSAGMSIEGVSGTIIAGFVLANREGFSRRCRSLMSIALLVARELGMHRIDHPSNAQAANTAEAEIGRRAWWYLIASDW